MSNTKPLFEVGEVVIRQAPKGNYPEWNGEYVVEDIITAEELLKLIPNLLVEAYWYYKLEGLVIPVRGAKSGRLTGDISHHSCEKFLRKKHQPGEHDFLSLITHLKSIQPIAQPLHA